MTKWNWISIAYVIASLITIVFLTNLSCNNRVIETYELSRGHTAPFIRLTLKGVATEGVTTINGSKGNLVIPQAPLEYKWASKDGRFVFHDEDIYTPDNETLEYNIEVSESGEVIPDTDTPIDSTVTITREKKIGLDLEVKCFVPDIFDLSAKYDVFKFNDLSLFGEIGYNSRAKLRIGVGINYAF